MTKKSGAVVLELVWTRMHTFSRMNSVIPELVHSRTHPLTC